MKLTKIESTPFTKSDEELILKTLKRYASKTNLSAVCTRSVNLPFRAFYLNTETPLLLINPYITKYSNDAFQSTEMSEFDTNGKNRIVVRAFSIEVQTDNLGLVVFKGDMENDREGLDECIFAQQMIDLLDGITIADKNINQPIRKQIQYERNQIVMAKDPDGNIEQIKYKNISKYIDRGYVLM
jgi:peptide deformylase